MGMAASQARFLSLTARKSNVEYEGQQINQERTSLANESSNLYGQLTKMEVPAPPNTSDFYKPVYTFTANEISGVKTTYTLEEVFSTPDGDYAKLSHPEPYFAAKANFIPAGNRFSVGDGSPALDKNGNIMEVTNNSGIQIGIGTKNYAVRYEDATTGVLDYLRSENSGFNTVMVNNGENLEEKLAYFEYAGEKYYLSAEQFLNQTGDNYVLEPESLMADASIMAALSVNEYTKTVTEDVPISYHETNNVGRTTSITVPVEVNGKETEITYELDCISVQDEDAYNQAMLDYEYYQAQYEKQVSEINAKTEEIQQQDKSLELELKQLDTEQNAISTEMDAVQKVVEDNVESTFKTFG